MGDETKGVVYVAFGSVFLAKALFSAETVRAHNPDIRICIVTNLEPPPEGAMPFWDDSSDHWHYIEAEDSENRIYKTNIIEYAPFDKCIYRDCDTFVTGSLGLAWTFLDYFDLALRLQDEPQKHRKLCEYTVIDNIKVRHLPHWNGGVVLFRSNQQVREFFRSWKTKFQASGLDFDQPSLVEALFKSEIKILTLDSRWNGGFRPLKTDAGRTALIIHYHSMYDHIIEKRLKRYHEIFERCGIAEKGKMYRHIRERNGKRLRNDPIQYLARRLYRRYWYRTNLGAPAGNDA